ncbi:rho GTPase-activating protein 40 [Echinops telfairi]|uniref:Rho GTPase-activating protein 40 n=1 Tax=Echinops telfairi TaxID=9371 RepID=A0AC55DI61_ECHTE|nr:rho GTPase-activating protein 40 [Echinops telfairi]
MLVPHGGVWELGVPRGFASLLLPRPSESAQSSSAEQPRSQPLPQPALLPAALMEKLAMLPLASPCPRIPRAHVARQSRPCWHWANVGCSSGPTLGQMHLLPQKTSPQQPPSAHCPRSRLSLAESLSLDGFWTEVERLQQQAEQPEEAGGAEGQLPEEGEAESQWLQDTGLWGLLGGLGMNGDHQGLLSTLTQTQVAAVCRRLDIYARSARRRHKAPVRDVRDIFGGCDSGGGSSADGGAGVKWNMLSSRLCHYPPAATLEGPQEQAGRVDTFSMDTAYSEQAAAPPQKCRPPPEGTCARSKVSLPKFRIPRGRLGVTRMGDLSLQDRKKIRPLVLIELTALCDVLGLDLKRSKAAKRRVTETRLFGVPLDALLEADRKLVPGTQVPLVLQALLSCLESKGLDMEGILRVPGSQARLKGLEQKLESDFYAGLFDWAKLHPNDAADLLKRFLRQLPAPMLTAEYLPAFALLPNIPDLKQRLQTLHLLILLLPEVNRNTLQVLLEFLRKVVARERSNKMTLWSVSMVMAPSLFLQHGWPPKVPKGKEKQLAEGAAQVVQLMVHYQELLWMVGAAGASWQGGSATPSMAKIHVPWPTKGPVEVLLTHSTKVAHVLRELSAPLSPKSQGQEGSEGTHSRLPCSKPRQSADICLYEVGGNIRSLAPNNKYMSDEQSRMVQTANGSIEA